MISSWNQPLEFFGIGTWSPPGADAQHSCDFCSKWQGWSPSAKAWLLLHRPWWLELGATKGWLHPARWQPINVAAHWLQPARPRLGTQVSCLAGAASQERKAWLNGLKMPWVQQLGLSSSYLEFQWIPFISHFHDWSLRHMWAGLRGMTGTSTNSYFPKVSGGVHEATRLKLAESFFSTDAPVYQLKPCREWPVTMCSATDSFPEACSWWQRCTCSNHLSHGKKPQHRSVSCIEISCYPRKALGLLSIR